MKLRSVLRFALSGLLLTAGCVGPPHYYGHPPSGSYAELRVRDSDNGIQLVICNDVPSQYYLGAEGGREIGGHFTFFGATLQGDGPVYRNPGLVIRYQGYHNSAQGTITVDRERNNVIIDLQVEDTNKFLPGEPPVIIPCPANGLYPIRLYIRAPWLIQMNIPG